MAKKKELDNLSKDMIRCKADGFGCDYGRWKAAHDDTKEEPEVVEAAPQGWLICQHCGKPFKPKTNRKQKYCEFACQYEERKAKDRERNRERAREYQRIKRENERKLRNESCA